MNSLFEYSDSLRTPYESFLSIQQQRIFRFIHTGIILWKLYI